MKKIFLVIFVLGAASSVFGCYSNLDCGSGEYCGGFPLWRTCKRK